MTCCYAGVNVNPHPSPHPRTRWGLVKKEGDLREIAPLRGWGLGNNYLYLTIPK